MLKKVNTFFNVLFKGQLWNTIKLNSWYLNYIFYGRFYKFDHKKYNDFLTENDSHNPELTTVKPIIYCFWTGNNEMNENRVKAFNALINTSEVEVKLITPSNLRQYISEDEPLHPAFEYLSLVHKSDYLRCYFMHFYGGGYADIKSFTNSWNDSFVKLNNSNKWMLGYKEPNMFASSNTFTNKIIEKDLQSYWSLLVGNCAYICRPKTPFTGEWYNELNKRLDYFYPELKKNPGNIWGNNEGYPIKWSEILGEIFHPLCLKYHSKIIQDNTIMPILYDYK